jgi:hypothetical protein
MSRIYVYAFCGSPVAPFTYAGRQLRSLQVAGIHIVCDRALPDGEVTEASLRRQHAIVEAVADRAEAVLPARAGAIVDERVLWSRVQGSQAALQAALRLVQGRQQMTLRLAASSSGPPATHESRSGTSYLEGRRTARMLPPELLGTVRATVSDLVHAERIRPGRGALPAAVFHLIRKGDAVRYRRRIDEEPSLAGTRPQVTGPFPPFAFTPELAE